MVLLWILLSMAFAAEPTVVLPAWAAAPYPTDHRWRPVNSASKHLDRRVLGRRASRAFTRTVARMDVHWAMVERGVVPLPLDREFERRAAGQLLSAASLAARDFSREAARRNVGFGATTHALSRVTKPRLNISGGHEGGLRRSVDAGATLRVREPQQSLNVPLVDAALHGRVSLGPHRLEASALVVRQMWIVGARQRITRKVWLFTSLRSRPGSLQASSLRFSTYVQLPARLELRGWAQLGSPYGVSQQRAGLSVQARWGGRPATALAGPGGR